MNTTSVEQNAMELAQTHAEGEGDILEIYMAISENEIRLIEVAETVGTTHEVLPFQFDPQPAEGLFFPISIVMVSVEEMEKIMNGTLPLPDGWGVPDRLQLIFRRER